MLNSFTLTLNFSSSHFNFVVEFITVSFPFQAIERAIQVLESLGGVSDPVRVQFHLSSFNYEAQTRKYDTALINLEKNK